MVPVETDKFGMRSDSLLEFMQQWSPEDANNTKSDIPKVIYTIPTCGNPTGVSASIERKKEIYEVFTTYFNFALLRYSLFYPPVASK